MTTLDTFAGLVFALLSSGDPVGVFFGVAICLQLVVIIYALGWLVIGTIKDAL